MSFRLWFLLVAKAMYIGGVYDTWVQVVTFVSLLPYFKPYRNLWLCIPFHLVEMVGCISK
jgi:hypothetical protein